MPSEFPSTRRRTLFILSTTGNTLLEECFDDVLPTMRTQLPILLCKGWVWIILGRGLDCTVGCLFFLPLWLTPPYYELYVLCGWKTELISHQDRAALVSKNLLLCAKPAPTFSKGSASNNAYFPREFGTGTGRSLPTFHPLHESKMVASKNKRHLQPLPFPGHQNLHAFRAAPNSCGERTLLGGARVTPCAGQQAGYEAPAALGCETQ